MLNFTRTSPISTALFLCAALLLGVSSTRAALLNPSFESPNASSGDQYGSTNWGAFNDAYTTANVTPNSGLQALKVFGPFFQFGGAGVVQGGFAASAGQQWQASAFLRTNTGDAVQGNNFAVVKIEFLDAGNAVIGAFESPHFTAANPQNVWTPEAVIGTAPVNTTSAQIVLVHVQLNSPVTGGSVFFDDAAFGLVPEPASLAGITMGLGAFGLRRRRRATQSA
jgi:hypothetical protein